MNNFSFKNFDIIFFVLLSSILIYQNLFMSILFHSYLTFCQIVFWTNMS
jgi:hypothetical protein